MALSLARALRFEPGTFAGHDREAYVVLSHLAAMPLELNHDRRRRYGIEILTNADQLMPLNQPQNTQFHRRLREQVIAMQEFPAWYSTLRNSNEQIVRSFARLWWALKGMEAGGLGGLSGMPADVNKGALAGMQGRNGVSGRALGAVRGGMAGAAGTVTGGLRGAAGVFWAIGSMLYVGGQDRLTELGNEIVRRYQYGQLSAELYQEAFGQDGPMPERFSRRGDDAAAGLEMVATDDSAGRYPVFFDAGSNYKRPAPRTCGPDDRGDRGYIADRTGRRNSRVVRPLSLIVYRQLGVLIL